MSIPTASLRIDTPEARQKAGVKGDPPSAKDVEKIQDNMLGPANLDAQRYPEITFKTASVTANGAESFVLSGPLTIRGVSRTVSVPVVHKGALFSGEFTVKLTDFGIKPESISGVVNVKDTIEVRLAFEGKLGGDCTPSDRQVAILPDWLLLRTPLPGAVSPANHNDFSAGGGTRSSYEPLQHRALSAEIDSRTS